MLILKTMPPLSLPRMSLMLEMTPTMTMLNFSALISLSLFFIFIFFIRFVVLDQLKLFKYISLVYFKQLFSKLYFIRVFGRWSSTLFLNFYE